jgi:hypothetical protein
MLHYYNFILAPSRLKTGKNQKYILIVGTPGHISATIKQSIKKTMVSTLPNSDIVEFQLGWKKNVVQ